MVTDMAFPVTVKASPFLRGVSSRGVVVGASGSQGHIMGGQVHKDEGGLLISSCQCCCVGQWLPPSHVILDLTVVEGRNKSFDEEYVIPRGGIRLRQVI